MVSRIATRIASNGADTPRAGCALSVLVLLLAAQGLVNAQSAPTTPLGLLKWSMTRYAALSTFQADCSWTETIGTMPGSQEEKRTLWVEKPSRFKVVSSHSGLVQTSVSDGTKLVEFTTGIAQPAQSYDSPSSIADATTMQMGHPMFCGSLLYKFFGGPARISALVNETKMPVSFGPTVTLEGQECKTVKFWAQGPTYGKTEVAIGVTDGLVHRIRYGSEPLMQMMHSGAIQEEVKRVMQSPEMKKQMQKAAAGKGMDLKAMQSALDNLKNMPSSSETTESYVHIAVGQPIAPAVFATKVPDGLQVQELGGGSEPQPPVALGARAPEITVTSPDGVKRKLSDFKGRVVLIDFWATWCPPCRKGLPATQKFYTDYGKGGLAVLTISDEAKATVMPFIKQNKYTFPVYLDTGGVTNKTYHIAAIPTVVVIDKNGNLVAYKVGLSPAEDILAELKKAGLETP